MPFAQEDLGTNAPDRPATANERVSCMTMPDNHLETL